MARYVDGYLLPVPRKKLGAYRRMAVLGGRVWRDCGALEYWECVGDDLAVKMGPGFPKTIKLKRGETAIFSWIQFRSRQHRDRVNAKVMKDPRLQKMMQMKPKDMPFDCNRMAFGGFKVLVQA
jgi:uncharacterized protein YbaA (DUF1428 family)